MERGAEVECRLLQLDGMQSGVDAGAQKINILYGYPNSISDQTRF
jgi:hypothetical protein